MQIIPAECRYLGLFVMAEVYHSRRLCCAASYELMMNGRRERWREEEEEEGERKKVGSCRAKAERDGQERETESEISPRH